MTSARGSVAAIYRKHPTYKMYSIIFLLIVSSSVCYSQEDRLYRPFQRPGRPQQTFDGRPPHFGHDNLIFDEDPMQVLYSWKQVDFTFSDDNIRQKMIQNQHFIPRNNLILDVDFFDDGYERKVFVTLPRVRPGVPVTLATVSSRRRNGANLLAPYPDWASQIPGDCENAITSVFRTHVDQCGRLWVLDSGNNDAFAGGNRSRIACPPQVLIYDIRNSNRLIDKFRIPSELIAPNSLLVTIAVDSRVPDCSDSYAYIADSIAYKMIVFSLQKKQFWRINSILFFPYPDQSTFTVNGLSFQLMGGIFGLSLGPLFRNRRILYFNCIDSVRQSWADTDDLRNQALWTGNMNAKPRAFNLFNGTRSSQSTATTMNKEGIMFFGLVGSNEIACWNSQTQFGGRNIVKLAKDDVTLQFNSGIKVYGDKLYAATSRLQNYINNQINENEDNYRVLVGDVSEITRGTSCEVNPMGNRFDTDDYTPNAESVEHPTNEEFSFAPN